MPPEDTPKLRFLHSSDTLNRGKMDFFRRLSTVELKESLAPRQPGSLKVRKDGTVLDGHHPVCVLIERGEDIDHLPREIIEKQP
jgi:hypothetical protein